MQWETVPLLSCSSSHLLACLLFHSTPFLLLPSASHLLLRLSLAHQQIRSRFFSTFILSLSFLFFLCVVVSPSARLSFILIYLTNLGITTLTSYSSENLKKIVRWISFTALCPQGTHGLLREKDEHMVTIQSVHMCAIYAYTHLYTHLCDVYISAYTHGWSLITILLLLSALSNHNIVSVAWHSYFYLSALKI